MPAMKAADYNKLLCYCSNAVKKRKFLENNVAKQELCNEEKPQSVYSGS